MDFRNFIGIGVAGNFTGHLEQAGEASSFVGTEVKDADAPKGIFPFYVPNLQNNFLSVYPLSSTTISMPEGSVLQPEPEVALVCQLDYLDGQVANITPTHFGAYNDCSIRKEAPKISSKKNWGENSKGVADALIEVDRFASGGSVDDYNLVCFLKRNGEVFEYGEDSLIKTYSYFYDKLLTWITEKMNMQQSTGPLENIHELLGMSNYPSQALISIGATRYTDFGAKTYLEKGDEVFIVVYPTIKYTGKTIKELIAASDKLALTESSILQQKVI